MSEKLTTEFATLSMSGKRFDEYGIPVEALVEIVAYSDLLKEVARHLWLGRNKDRSRLPRNFWQGADLRLKRAIEDGSAVAHLERSAVPLNELFVNDVLTESRNVTMAAVEEVAAGKDLPAGFPRAALAAFNRFGRTLKPDEAIELRSPTRQSGPRYTQDVRKHLVLLGNASYERDVTLFGRVLEIQTGERKQFTLRDDDNSVVRARYGDTQFDQIKRSLDADGRGPTLRVEGLGLVDGRDSILMLTEVSELRVISDDKPVEAYTEARQRLVALSQFSDGWLDGDGLRPSGASILASERLLTALENAGVPRPKLYPTEEGGVQMEWTIEAHEISANVSPDDGSVTVFDVDDDNPDNDNEIMHAADSQVAELLRELL